MWKLLVEWSLRCTLWCGNLNVYMCVCMGISFHLNTNAYAHDAIVHGW